MHQMDKWGSALDAEDQAGRGMGLSWKWWKKAGEEAVPLCPMKNLGV